MKKFLMLVACCVVPFAPLKSFAKCYSAAEAEAEQAIRIHSELMVIGLNCQAMASRYGENPYGQYAQLTSRNAGLFANYEKTLINYFRDTGVPKPESSFNNLRTVFANRISQQVAAKRPDVFCAENIKRLSRVANMSEDELRAWAVSLSQQGATTQPICASAGAR